MSCGLYRVLPHSVWTAYRGHEPGTEFAARIEPRAEQRAIMRGGIERIGTVVLKPENYTFPEGWLASQESDHEAAKAASLIEGGS